ncbi:hypothetical protein ACFL13_02035 [Patescibacteria group bacterium]
MNYIQGSGWFVNLLSGLASGDPRFVEEYINEEYPLMLGEKGLWELFHTLQFAKVARTSRRGWQTIDHPILGTVQWKIGRNYRNAKPYMFVRVNGKEIIHLWRTSAWLEFERTEVTPFIEERMKERVANTFVQVEGRLHSSY